MIHILCEINISAGVSKGRLGKTSRRRADSKKTDQIASNCSRPNNRAENRAPPRNAIKLQKPASQKLRTQNLAKLLNKGSFWRHKYFEIGTCAKSLHNATPQKTYLHKGNTLSKWVRAQLAHEQIQVCVFTQPSSCPMGWAICDILAFFVVATLVLWNACFHSVKHVWAPNWLCGGPWTGPALGKTWAHIRPPGIYIYIYMYVYVYVYVCMYVCVNYYYYFCFGFVQILFLSEGEWDVKKHVPKKS